MLFCGQCGQQSAPGSAFCGSCGGPLAAAGPGGMPHQMAPPQGNGMGVASMVLGIIGLVMSWFLLGIPSILAVIFGHVGISTAKQRNGAGRGMAIAGLVMGYIAIGLYVTLLAVGLSIAGGANF